MLLCGPKNPFGVTPWLDHDIQLKNTKIISICLLFLWTPWSSHGVTQWVLPVHATMPRRNDIEQKRLGTIRSSHGMTEVQSIHVATLCNNNFYKIGNDIEVWLSQVILFIGY